jgi:hypothetical protein
MAVTPGKKPLVSSAAAPNASAAGHDETTVFWQRRAGRLLSDFEARQIIKNATGFFRLLGEWQARESSSR